VAIPATQHELTFADFWQLLHNPHYRRTTAELLAEWFGHEVGGEGQSPVVTSRDGLSVDPVDLHLRIQSDPEKQQALYQTAMSLWR